MTVFKVKASSYNEFIAVLPRIMDWQSKFWYTKKFILQCHRVAVEVSWYDESTVETPSRDELKVGSLSHDECKMQIPSHDDFYNRSPVLSQSLWWKFIMLPALTMNLHDALCDKSSVTWHIVICFRKWFPWWESRDLTRGKVYVLLIRIWTTMYCYY